MASMVQAVLCISELSKRLAKSTASTALSFDRPETIASYYMEELRHCTQEITKIIYLNTKAKYIGETDISKGTVNASIITPRELFIHALQMGAVSIVLLHNHPSGDPTPSSEDVLITRRIKEAGKIIGIDLVDHIIIGNQAYISFNEQRIL